MSTNRKNSKNSRNHTNGQSGNPAQRATESITISISAKDLFYENLITMSDRIWALNKDEWAPVLFGGNGEVFDIAAGYAKEGFRVVEVIRDAPWIYTWGVVRLERSNENGVAA
jgi:hypothetical protein